MPMLYCLVGKFSLLYVYEYNIVFSTTTICKWIYYIAIDSILKPSNQLNIFYEYYYYLGVVSLTRAKCGSIVV